jgi:putative ABC transport system substrate-binding protein
MMRREFITLLGGAAAWPLAARAQSASLRRVGVLMNGAATDAVVQSYLAAFKQGLRELQHVPTGVNRHSQRPPKERV